MWERVLVFWTNYTEMQVYLLDPGTQKGGQLQTGGESVVLGSLGAKVQIGYKCIFVTSVN